jgi:hypothetical protein
MSRTGDSVTQEEWRATIGTTPGSSGSGGVRIAGEVYHRPE